MEKVFFALIRSAITDEKANVCLPRPIPEDTLAEWISLAKKHDIYQLLARGLTLNGLVAEDDARFRGAILKAALRCERLQYVYENLCRALETAEIPFMPLKGSVLRAYYKEPWMRTSCDIDVLVHPEALDRAVSYLTEHCGYAFHHKALHDVSLYSPDKIHLELHFGLVLDGMVNNSSDILKRVWDTALLKAGHAYFYEMSDAMFYFYHIAHMGQHFLRGGCGIRPFVDLLILDRIEDADDDRRELLREAELLPFAESCQKLSDVWFNGAPEDPISQEMAAFILRGGVYGTLKNLDRMKAGLGETRTESFLKIVFLPYNKLKDVFPRLEKHPILFPFYQTKRWARIFIKEKRENVIHLTKVRNSVTATETDTAAKLLSDLGLYR